MQQLVVALIVLVAALYAVWHFLPARWRQRLVMRAGLNPRIGQAGSCDDCDECGACEPSNTAKK